MVDDNVSLLARFAERRPRLPVGNRYSPKIGDGTDLYGTEGTIHIATETISPFASAPLAVYTEKSADDLPDVLREAHYPDAWWKTFDGGWITVKPPRAAPTGRSSPPSARASADGKPATITGLDGLRAQEVVQGAYLSMRTGGWVDLPLADGRALHHPRIPLRRAMYSCFHSVGLPDRTLEEAIGMVAAAGYGAIELNAETLPWAPAAHHARDRRRGAQARGRRLPGSGD